MKVRDFMSKNLVYVSPETSVTDAKALMMKEKISKLPVLDKSNRLVGLITKNDLKKADPSSASTLDIYELGYLLSKLKVEKIMIKKVETVDAEEVVEEAARFMADRKIGCLPVMENGVLSGIITETDIFKAFVTMFGARHPGVRSIIQLNEKPGELAKIVDKIAEKNGNIVSLVTADGKDVTKKAVTIKVGNISKSDIEEIYKNADVEIIDIRETK